MSLKELTLKEHKFAEEQDFANLMMSGNIENYVYFHYLINQYSIYNALENTYYNLPDNRLARAKAIDTDIEELKLMGPMPMLCYELEPSTNEYVQYVKEHIQIHNTWPTFMFAI
jgi:heme oxygenase